MNILDRKVLIHLMLTNLAELHCHSLYDTITDEHTFNFHGTTIEVNINDIINFHENSITFYNTLKDTWELKNIVEKEILHALLVKHKINNSFETYYDTQLSLCQ